MNIDEIMKDNYLLVKIKEQQTIKLIGNAEFAYRPYCETVFATWGDWCC